MVRRSRCGREHRSAVAELIARDFTPAVALMRQENSCGEYLMFMVIFEVQPKKERFDEYLGLARELKPALEAIDGFIDNERFESKRPNGCPPLPPGATK